LTAPFEQLPAYLTPEEVQEYLSIGRSSAYVFARKHGKRFGRLLRVPREALLEGEETSPQ
jgi:hypothetical protein